jgi:hypothetical protein
MATSVDPSDFEGLIRYVHGVDVSARESLRTSDSDTSGPRTDVEHTAHSAGVDPRGKAPLDELGDGRPWDQHARIHFERQPGKPGFAGEVNSRHSFLDASRYEIAHALLRVLSHTLRVNRSIRVVREPQGMEHQRCGFVERIVGPMAEKDFRTMQAAGTTLNERTDRNGLRASYDAAGPVE